MSLIFTQFESSNLHDALLARATKFLDELPSENLRTYDSKLTEDMRNNVSRYIDYLKTLPLNNATYDSVQDQDQQPDNSVVSIPPLTAEPYDPNAIDHEKEAIMAVYYDTYKSQIQSYHQLMDFLPADSRFPVVLASQLERITKRMEVLRVQFSTVLRRNKTLDGWFHSLIQQGHKLLEQVQSFEQQTANPLSPTIPFSSGQEQSTPLPNWNRLSGASTQFSSFPTKREESDYADIKIKSSPGSPTYNSVSNQSDWANNGATTKTDDNNNEPVHIPDSNKPQPSEIQEELTLAQLGPQADIWNDPGKREMFYASDEDLDSLRKPTKRPRHTKKSTHRPVRDIGAILDEARELIGPLEGDPKPHVKSPVLVHPAQEAEPFPPSLAENKSYQDDRLTGMKRNGNNSSTSTVQQHNNDNPDRVTSSESTTLHSGSSTTGRNGEITNNVSLGSGKSINNSNNGKEKAIPEIQNQILAAADNFTPETVTTSSIAGQSNGDGNIVSQKKPLKRVAKQRPQRFTRNSVDPVKKMKAMTLQQKKDDNWVLPKELEPYISQSDSRLYNSKSAGTRNAVKDNTTLSGPGKRQHKLDKQQNPVPVTATESSQKPTSTTTEREQRATSAVSRQSNSNPVSKGSTDADTSVGNGVSRRKVRYRRSYQTPLKRAPGYVYLPHSSDDDSDNIVFISDSE